MDGREGGREGGRRKVKGGRGERGWKRGEGEGRGGGGG